MTLRKQLETAGAIRQQSLNFVMRLKLLPMTAPIRRLITTNSAANFQNADALNLPRIQHCLSAIAVAANKLVPFEKEMAQRKP